MFLLLKKHVKAKVETLLPARAVFLMFLCLRFSLRYRYAYYCDFTQGRTKEMDVQPIVLDQRRRRLARTMRVTVTF